MNTTTTPLINSADEIASIFELLNGTAPEPPPKKWSPNATTSEVINGAARDLSDLIALLIARQRIAVGYQADSESIILALKLTRSLRELSDINHLLTPTSPGKKRGRPPKLGNFTPNTKPAGQRRNLRPV